MGAEAVLLCNNLLLDVLRFGPNQEQRPSRAAGHGPGVAAVGGFAAASATAAAAAAAAASNN